MEQEKREKSSTTFPVVGIGASAGGLDAFKKLIATIPENSGMAFVLVQHLAPSRESILSELLQKMTTLPVLEVADEIRIESDHIYVIPSTKMLTANDGVLHLTPRVQDNKIKRNVIIDVFFKSLAEVHEARAVGVILSGAASDGTDGLRAIKDYGGITFAQELDTAAYESMPNSAIEAGVVDFILPPEKIMGKILEVTKGMSETAHKDKDVEQQEETIFKHINSLLRLRKGTDFTYYKQTTIRRRILRRMALNKSLDPGAYLKYLRENKSEQDILYQDLLIPVTTFFRDPVTFENLSDNVIPNILKNKAPGEPVRIWVAGCSTGQEAYSIAICLREALGNRNFKMQIFASDISENAIAKARIGIYDKRELEMLSPERLQDYFTKVGDNYQVNKWIREMCIFAIHNFLKDPPFGKIDLVSCRNVLIYMSPYLQKKALGTFHYALNPKGYLLLGKSETISNVPELFVTVGKNDKLFIRKDGPGKHVQVATQRVEEQYSLPPVPEAARNDFQKTADEIILSKYVPTGVVVNEAMDIVHFRGKTSRFLEQTSGKPSHNLLKMAKEGLAFELRNLIHKASKEKTAVKKVNIRLALEEGGMVVTLEAIPLPNTIDPHYLVLFHEKSGWEEDEAEKAATKKSPRKKVKEDEKDLRIRQLEYELAQTREDMRSITEDQEVTNEELQSANEELLSSSEELQSLNEELETGKEELQSTNEELLIVNQEMISLTDQLKLEKDYAESIVETIREPLVVLDMYLRVKSANESYYKTFRTNESETEGRLFFELGKKQWNIPELRSHIEAVLSDKSKFSNFEVKVNFRNLGERIMLLSGREIKEKSSEPLVLLAIDDVTDQRGIEEERQAKKHFQFIADAMPQKVWTADAKGKMNYFNKLWLEYADLSMEELKNGGWKKMVHPEDLGKIEVEWQHAIDTGFNYELELRFLHKSGEYKWHLSRGAAFKDAVGQVRVWVGTDIEFQEQKHQKEVLEKAIVKRNLELREANTTLGEKNNELENLNRELQSFAYVSSHDLQEPLRKIRSFAGRILEKENANLSDTGKDYFHRMQDAANRMQTLIEDLLTFSRVNTTERKFELTDLNLIVRDVKRDLREAIEEKNAVIEMGTLCEANIIPFQFRQLMLNLFTNSLKFSKPNVPPHIIITSKIMMGDALQVKKLDPEKEYCHIRVQDTGIGFEPEFNEKIFEVFQRLHGKDEYPGTGIGLAIVKKIVENHNGFITASGELGKGARFDIYLPHSN